MPSDSEWTAMQNVLGGWLFAGGKLKDTGTIEEGTGLWYSPNEGATNETGFTALPGGARGYGPSASIGFTGYWWSSTQYGSGHAWTHAMSHRFSTVIRMYDPFFIGYSVRCIKK